MGFFEVVKNIYDGHFPRTSRKYPRSHRRSSGLEKRRFGAKAFKNLTRIIQRKIPKGQLAGTNTKRGKLEVNKRIPPKFRPEVGFHEGVESKLMHGMKIKNVTGLGKHLRIHWVKK